MRRLLASLLVTLWAMPLQAQDTPDPLVVPFAEFPPFLYLDDTGERTGFIAMLALEIGEEIGVPITFLDVAGPREWIAAQASGRAQLIPGVVQLPLLAETSLFSDQVATDTLRPAVLSTNQALIELGVLTDQRVGVVPPSIGSDEPVLAQNRPSTYDSAHAAILHLLTGQVDALLIPPPVVLELARDANLDGRIAFIGPPLREETRHVALHESRAELLPVINAAIARMEADGRLEALRLRYNITVPPPPPEVLRVGVAHLPPLSIIAEDGGVSGFNVDVTQALAERAGFALELVPLSLTDWVQGPTANGLDAIAALVINDARQEVMDFSYPILERTIAVVADEGELVTAQQISDLVGQRIGTVDGSVFARRALETGIEDVIGYSTNTDVITALAAQEFDIALLAPTVAQDAIERTNLEDRLQVVSLRDETIDTAIALRPGLGAVREQLNAVIPGYLLSEDYAALRERYFGEPVFWTPARIYGGLGAIGVLVLGLLGLVFWQRQQQQHRDFARQKAHAEELGKVVFDLEIANTELERSNRELEEFAYIASHDLKEPLRGIGINANFLAAEDLPDPISERVTRMGALARRMETLVSDLLYFSRLGHANAEQETIQPAEIIGHIRTDLDEWLKAHNGEIVEVEAIPSLRGDRSKITTVFQNLIVNGIKYNDASARRVEIGFLREVTVNGRPLQNVIYAQDNGIGIEAEHRDKIFRIFSRLNTRSSYGDGTGSGLAFVRKIVEDTGGVIDFTSVPGTGTCFYLTLPLAERIS